MTVTVSGLRKLLVGARRETFPMSAGGDATACNSSKRTTPEGEGEGGSSERLPLAPSVRPSFRTCGRRLGPVGFLCCAWQRCGAAHTSQICRVLLPVSPQGATTRSGQREGNGFDFLPLFSNQNGRGEAEGHLTAEGHRNTTVFLCPFFIFMPLTQ